MTVQQLGIFDIPATRGASRRSDPATSREAARSVSGEVLRDQQALVLGCIRGDATAWEITTVLLHRGHGVQQNVVAKRLTELRELGMVRLTGETRPGVSHRRQQVWTVTDKGREAVA